MRSSVRWAAQNGGDIDAAVRAAGITAGQLATPGGRCTPEQMSEFVRQLWRLTDDEFFGVGQLPVPRGTFGLLTHGLIHAPDLGRMLERLAGFLPALVGLPSMRASRVGDAVEIEFDIDSSRDPQHLLTEFLLMVFHRFMSWVSASTIYLTTVELPYAPTQPAAVYTALFGAPVRFDAGRTALILPATLLDRPVVRRQADLVRYLQESPLSIFERRDYGDEASDQVRAVLMACPVRQWPDAATVATRLGYSESHLRRLLRTEGSSVTAVRDELLRDRAVEAVVRGDTVDRIAERLGFSDARAFRRAFKRWTGNSPSEYQRPS